MTGLDAPFRYASQLPNQIESFILTCQHVSLRTGENPLGSRLDQDIGVPAVLSCSDTAQICGPTLIWVSSHRGQRLNSGSKPDGSLLDLPALELKDALHRVLVHVQQIRHRAVTKRRVFFDHGFDRLYQMRL